LLGTPEPVNFAREPFDASDLVIQRWHAAIILLAACGGAGGGASADGSVAPSTGSARGVVESFMEAVADSNLTQLANLWGSAGGPAAKTGQPPDYEKRVAVMQAYLRNESHRLLPSPASDAPSQVVNVEIRRELCTWVVPFTAIRLGDGNWVVNQVDLTKAGNPARPCVPAGAEDTTSTP
jgi:hypothetical protein